MDRNILNIYNAVILIVTLYAKASAGITVSEGNNVSIPCNVTKSSDMEIYWTKNSSDSTLEIKGAVLYFTNISRIDSGQYLCNSFNKQSGKNVTEGSVTVDVYYKASVKSITVSPSVMHENESYTVTCDFEGNPAPKWQIRLKDSILEIGQSSGVYKTRMHTGNCGDTGHVTCEAKNSLNNGSEVLMQNITVFCSPRPIWLNRYRVTAPVGGFTALVMMAHGYPYPQFTWSRDDGESIKGPVQTNLREISILNITNIKTRDYANYSLTMNNSYGSYVAHYQLFPSGKYRNKQFINNR
ncbi:hemicentin-2-like [Mercenaria mercenaria]|uniref:hemicentin-2-like n=1 Tax=Mercenaria mercenaria TaxID=6596 RepID=UPI00234FA5BE|nr:hemicentin-2-like [Mercenaria mercenaria]